LLYQMYIVVLISKAFTITIHSTRRLWLIMVRF